MLALYLLFLPPLLLSGSPDDRCRCPCVRLLRGRPCTPTVELPGKQCPVTSPSYRLPVFTCLFALGISCCYVTILFNCIAYHCRPLITFSISYAALTIYY